MVTGKQSSIVKQRRVIEDEVKLDVQYGKEGSREVIGSCRSGRT